MGTYNVKEGTGGIYTATLKDADGVVLPLASLSSITLTLYNMTDQSIINNRDGQDVKNANNVNIHVSSGLLTWLMQAADNAIIGDNIAEGASEHHRALFEFVYVGNGSPGKHEVDIYVENLIKV